MFGFLKKRRQKQLQAAASAAGPATKQSSRQYTGLHRELVRGVFNDVMRINALPKEALTFEAFFKQRSSGKSELHIQLMAMEWNEKLQYQAPLLQQQIQSGMERCAQFLDMSQSIVSWRFSPSCCQTAAQLLSESLHVAGGSYSPERRRNRDRRRENNHSKNFILGDSLFVPSQRDDSFIPTEFSGLRPDTPAMEAERPERSEHETVALVERRRIGRKIPTPAAAEHSGDEAWALWDKAADAAPTSDSL